MTLSSLAIGLVAGIGGASLLLSGAPQLVWRTSTRKTNAGSSRPLGCSAATQNLAYHQPIVVTRARWFRTRHTTCRPRCLIGPGSAFHTIDVEDARCTRPPSLVNAWEPLHAKFPSAGLSTAQDERLIQWHGQQDAPHLTAEHRHRCFALLRSRLVSLRHPIESCPCQPKSPHGQLPLEGVQHSAIAPSECRRRALWLLAPAIHDGLRDLHAQSGGRDAHRHGRKLAPIGDV